ncbi:MAG: DUF2953 domain-containing protein [candidate division Zixibacteria bacterium]|nr:DUF2953 domain-containing protein [candidate division Zixibacteria bacterium]
MSIWIIIVVSLALVLIAALTVPVYLKFHISSDRRLLTIKYGRIRIKRFGSLDMASEIPKSAPKLGEDKSEKPSKRDSWTLFRFEKLARLKKWAALAPQITRPVANLIWRILRNMKVESLRGEVAGGFSDPALTGIMLGWSSAILGAVPALGRNISIKPDFDAEKIHYEASGMIRLNPLKVTGSLLRFLIEAPLFRIIKLTLTRG